MRDESIPSNIRSAIATVKKVMKKEKELILQRGLKSPLPVSIDQS